MAGVTRPEVPIMIKRVGEPTLALRSFIHKFSSHRVPRTRERESERERERATKHGEKAKREKERTERLGRLLARQTCASFVGRLSAPFDNLPDAFFFFRLSPKRCNVILDVQTYFSN